MVRTLVPTAPAAVLRVAVISVGCAPNVSGLAGWASMRSPLSSTIRIVMGAPRVSVEFSTGNPLVRMRLLGQCPDPQQAVTVPFDEGYGALHPDEFKGAGRYEFSGGYTIPGAGSPVLA